MAKNNTTADEPTLEVDDFGKAAVESGAKALALRLQTLLLTEKGTYPNNYNIGVAINRYDFEFLDPETIGEMQKEITQQIASWQPGAPINRVIVDRMDTFDSGKRNAVLVAFELGGKLAEETKFIAIALQKDRTTSRVRSEIIIS